MPLQDTDAWVSSRWVEGRGLEEFDDVAGGVLEQDLPAAWSFEDVVAKRGTRGAEACDFAIDVLHYYEVNAVPAARPRLGTIEAKKLCIEGNRYLNVVNHVADTYHVAGVSHVASPCLARSGSSIGAVRHGPRRPTGLLGCSHQCLNSYITLAENAAGCFVRDSIPFPCHIALTLPVILMTHSATGMW